jgi:predicted transcriptional regulator
LPQEGPTDKTNSSFIVTFAGGSIGGLLKRKGLSTDDINTIFKSINESGFVTPQSEKEVTNLGCDLAERYDSVEEDYIWSEGGLSDRQELIVSFERVRGRIV